MPAIVEFAKKHWIWLAGAGALIVAVLYLRSRAASQAAPVADSGAGFGAGATTPSAPANMGNTQADYQGQLDQLQLQAGQQQLAQQQKMFDIASGAAQQQAALQGQYAQGILQSAIGASNAQLAEQGAAAQTGAAEQGALANQIAKTGASCPGNASLRWDPQQGWYCREKTSGGILGIPVGQIVSAIGNAIGGVQAGIGPAAQQVTGAAGQATSGALQQLIPQWLGLPPTINPQTNYGAQGAAGGQVQAIPIQGNVNYSPAINLGLLAQQPPPAQVSINTGNVPRPISQGGPNQFSGLPPASGIG